MIDNEHLKEMPCYTIIIRCENQTYIIKDIVLHWVSAIEEDEYSIYAVSQGGKTHMFDFHSEATLEVKK